MTAADLSEYVGAAPADIDYVEECWDTAHALVDKAVGTASVPAAVMKRAKLECGSELYHKRSAPMGVSQFASADGAPMRVGLDPMRSAMKVLMPFLPLSFA